MPPKPKLKRDWVGLKVRTLRELQTGMLSIPEGTILTVTGNRGGLRLCGEPCTYCGIRVFIHGVSEYAVTIVTEEQRS